MMYKLVLLVSLFAFAAATFPRRAPRLDGRIVGGENTEIEKHPHQISMLRYGSHSCGGSILNPTTIVTAAHCTNGAAASSLSIRAGSSVRSGGQVVNVAEIRQNPDYESWTTNNDVSILVLAEPLVLGDGVQPIELVSSEPVDGDDAVCTGWGTLSEGGFLPNNLQEVTVQIVDRKVCKQKYIGYTISESMICAAVDGGGKDACQGDSGGPLVVGGKLAGIVSWGLGCARPDYPGVYANVHNLANFINANSA